MKARRMDVEKGIYSWIPSNLLMVTFKGVKISEKIGMYNGLVKIPVRPYVESVVQCYQCYGYGHWKNKCKKERVCIVCGEKYHRMCEKKKKRVNCRRNHKVNDRKCEMYIRREEINRRMANEGINGQEAKKRTGEERRKEAERTNRRNNMEGLKEEEENRIGEARGGVWADNIRRKDQEVGDIYGEKSDRNNKIDVFKKKEKRKERIRKTEKKGNNWDREEDTRKRKRE